jgi:hypothetical protein
MNSPADRRVFVRHTTDVPLEVERMGTPGPLAEKGVDVSHGGLAFLSSWCPETGETIRLRIPSVDPPFEAQARVTWCREESGGYLVGVAFLDASDAFRSRMVEQVCAIEKYRIDVQAREGRELTTSDAAAEWIARFAKGFPGATP